MHIVITGGTGLIGQALAWNLVERGYEVTLLSRRPEKPPGMPPSAVIQQWDGQTAIGWAHVVDGADAVVNLAGENISQGRWTGERKRRIRESRLNAGRAVVEAIEAASRKPRVLIQASGVGYYGDRGDERLTESSEPGADFLAQLAIEWEASTAAVEAQGVRRAVIRTGVVLSAEGGALPRMVLPFRFFVGGKMGSGRQWLPWIHIADEVNAIRLLIEREDASGAFNITAPNPVINSYFSHILGQHLERPSPVPLPAPVLRIVFGEMANVLLFSERAVPKRLLESDYVFRFDDAATALRDLLPRG